MKIYLEGVILCLGTLHAQARPEIGIAFKGGANAAILSGDNVDHKYGFTGGLAGYSRWPLGRLSLGMQIDLLYSPRGAELVRADEYLGEVRQYYLDMAVAIRPEIRVGEASVYLLLGGGWSVLLKASSYGAASGMTNDVTDFVNRHDVALLAGAGGAFHLAHKTLGPLRLSEVFLEVRHDRGLIDIDPAEDNATKNRTASIMLGLSFALGSKSE